MFIYKRAQYPLAKGKHNIGSLYIFHLFLSRRFGFSHLIDLNLIFAYNNIIQIEVEILGKVYIEADTFGLPCIYYKHRTEYQAKLVFKDSLWPKWNT